MVDIPIQKIILLSFLSKYLDGLSLPSDEIISRHNVTSSVVMLGCHTHCEDEEKCVGFNYRTTKNVENCQLTNVTNNRENLKRGDWILMRNAEAVGRYNNPGQSCLDILQRTERASLGNGEYWVLLDNKPLNVYCDMKADGGGWTLVNNLVQNGSKEMDWFLANDYRRISEYKNKNLALSTYALRDLRSKMSFNQIRFFCRKKIPGRVLDIATKTNSLGQQVIKYFTAQTNTFPKSCGSYYRLPDDNSILASQCSRWGRESNNTYFVGKWGIDGSQVKARLFNHPAFVSGQAQWFTGGSKQRWECDDFYSISGYTISPDDFWKIFVR
ncbi:uncharacterized protein LOC114539640 isoform X1 [Dendronephthya gigantea]|uniref:uncharacterized protein LOC114539640 isoform X1 n=1 Tax=Dendronephthya gigantea TaxID=151771 RepID=UPI00106B9AFA|nr:uncharacterized protein LOC114539640 isoform X1 [Dendronephthya gigantea]